MRTAKRIITASLTAIMIFQALAPSTEIFAQELDAAWNGSIAAAHSMNNAVEGAKSAIAQFAEDASSDEDADNADTPAPGDSAITGDEMADGAGQDGTEDDSAGDAQDGMDNGDEAESPANETAEDRAADETASAAADGSIDTIEKLNDTLGNYGSATQDADGVKITYLHPEALIILSNVDPELYRNASIAKDGGLTGGDLGLTAEVKDDQSGKTYTFKGFGSETVPFEGTFDATNLRFEVNTSFYNNVKLNDSNKNIRLVWKGTSSAPIFANKIEGNGQTLDATVDVAVGEKNDDPKLTGISSSFLGTTTGDLTLKVAYTFSGSHKGIGISAASGNAGLLVNTVESGSLTVNGLNGMESVEGSPSVAATAEGACAGGLIGLVDDGVAKIAVNDNIDLSKLTVAGKEASGGFIGKATNLVLDIAEGKTIKPALKVGDASTKYAGGIIGRVSFKNAYTVKPSMFSLDEKAVELGAYRRAGGLFGMLDVTNGDVTVQGGTYKSKLASGSDKNSGQSPLRGSYGGIAGSVCGTSGNTKYALNVKRDTDIACSIEIERASGLAYTGGVVGYIGDNGNGDIANGKKPVAVVIEGAEVVCKGSAIPPHGNGKYGGVVGVLDTDNVLDVRDFKLTTDGEIGNSNGGSAGIAGSAWRGILKFSGVTDLSGVKYADSNLSAQLVYENYNSLIFATGSGSDEAANSQSDASGWKYIRSTAAAAIDDIHDYGQVIRLGGNLNSDLIQVDRATHELNLNNKLVKGSDGYTLNNANDFAKLAITWQTFGYFSMVDGVGQPNFESLLPATIVIAGSIDLSGTGITGIMKDRAPDTSYNGRQEERNLYESACPFKGKLTGTGSISLAVGESFGMRNGADLRQDPSDGDGKVYRHGRLGLFSIIDGATVDGSVSIGGQMRFDAKNGASAGALAAARQGDSKVSISGLTVGTAIDYDNSNWKDLNLAGLIGDVSGAGQIAFEADVTSKAAITSNSKENGNIRVGEAIGHVAADSSVSIGISDLSVKGKIDLSNGSQGNVLAGGLIGHIEQGTTAVKSVSITGLVFDGFELTTNANYSSAASYTTTAHVGKTAGGLLGYSWGNTKVTIGGDSNSESSYALTTKNTKVTANEATEFGGLAYAASGSWTVSKYAIDLRGATLNAPEASVFGLLVCRGSSAASGYYIGMDSLSGLYLENDADWKTAYLVNEDANAITASAKLTCFDEWVADDVRPDNSKLDDWNKNGVVSLHTTAEKLNMTGSGSMGSYENRTVYGESHKTNAKTRYFYNLDRARTYVSTLGRVESATGVMQTPEELLLWSATHYAAAGIRSYIVPSTWIQFKYDSAKFVGDTAEIDLDGYSFYPIDISGANVTIRNVSIKFHFSDIKGKETDNKLNSEITQHMAMHASLLRSFAPLSNSDNTVSVSNVVLAGSIGLNVGTSGSGALLSGNVSGSTAGIARVSINGLKLDGIVVDGAKDNSYKPLLINNLPNRADLTVNDIEVKEASSYATGTKAASSLFGNLGGSSADMVSASFSNICVPSNAQTGDALFTHASLLESFGYGTGKTGSATYIFYKDDKKTYGSEIDANGKNNEYVGEQLWYYDSDLHSTKAGLVNDGTRTADETGKDPKYGVYLPYVKKGKEGTSYHEIKVNQRVPSLEVGCGTYGDPYKVTSAAEIYAVTNYINNKADVRDGWKVTITTNQNELCTRRSADDDNHLEVTYTYSLASKEWVNDADPNQTFDNDTMHRYLQSAYYSIEPVDADGETINSIELDGDTFNGFGNESNPFRGVIVGNLKNDDSNTSLVINNGTEKTVSGLIPYSYGSVVKGINITYAGQPIQVKYAAKDQYGVPGSFFGGVIGCIMGGDNIIDGVTVDAQGGCAATASGSNANLVPIGGYVGAIAGGGVIFRNMDGSSWRASTKDASSLYDNPYVGRVLDGFAFSEGCEVDNGDSNYKINELDTEDTGCVTTVDTYFAYNWSTRLGQNEKAPTVTVNDAQGLLVLSAIINSGAATGSAYTDDLSSGGGTSAGSRAYQGRRIKTEKEYKFGNEQYGKVRNASYANVGKAGSDQADWETSKNDDLKAPGNQKYAGPLDSEETDDINSPYLVRKYANWATGFVCANGINGLNIKFVANVVYDMTPYGSGYLGLSGRYYSNACVSETPAKDRYYITPQIACIDGNSAIITVNNKAKEYTDDSYKVLGIGALLNSITYASEHISESVAANEGATVRNLTFRNCNISINYYAADGTADTNQSAKNVQVGLGCLAGVTANSKDQSAYGKYSNVVIDGCTVGGAANAGGLLGSSSYMLFVEDTNNKNDMALVNYNNNGRVSPVKLADCKLVGSTVEAEANAGGFVGKVATGTVSLDSTKAENSIIENSTVLGTRGWSPVKEACTVGGVVGLTAASVTVGANTPEGSSMVFKDFAVTTDLPLSISSGNIGTCAWSRGIGGVVGRVEGVQTTVKKVAFQATEGASGSQEASAYVGARYRTNPVNRYGSSIYKSVGGVVGYTSGSVSVEDCSVENIEIAAAEASAAVAGYLDGGNQFSADGVRVSGVQIDGAYSAGLLGQSSGQNCVVTISNSSVSSSMFKSATCSDASQHPEGGHTYSGGYIGFTKGTIRMSNVLASNNVFEDPSHQGQLFGDVAAYNINSISIAGVDIEIPNDKTSADVPTLVHYRQPQQAADVNKKMYVAFADYKDSFDAANGLYSDSDTPVAVAYPYVVTNPVSDVTVKPDAASDAKALFGDGVAIETAKTIKDEAGSSKSGQFTYTNIGGRDDNGAYRNTNDYDAEASQSTFNTNNFKQGEAQSKNDFNVLLIPGNDSTTVENYLNIVTNGGFSDAKRLNGSIKYVTATTQSIQLTGDGENSEFVKSDANPSLEVVNNGASNMAFRASTDWDNGKSRFTLLTVTFNDGANHLYKVQVPIVVKRMLEIDFNATYTYGTKFNKDGYSTLDNHVLTSVGDAMTGYLTWTYNQAKGVASQYGWSSYLESGGAMGPLNKSIVFDGSRDDDGYNKGTMPYGTQLTLVDTANNNKEYSYTVSDVAGVTSVKLADFTDSNDRGYEEKWLSEIMQVQAKPADDGAWVQLRDDASAEEKAAAVAKVDGKYYKRWQNGETGDRYTLSVPNEDPRSENFYLVVRVPSNSTVTVNGFTGTSVDTRLNTNINYTKRVRPSESDSHVNTGSTYSIASSYTHTITDNRKTSDTENIVRMIPDSNLRYDQIKMDVTDTINFGENEYNSNDSLYYQIESSLVNYSEGGQTASGYPRGTTGTVNLYVKVGETYYVWNADEQDASTGNRGVWRPSSTETNVWGDESGIPWPETETGDDMSIVLADKNGNAIDLQKIREIAKGNGSTFQIIMKADLVMTEAAAQAGIVASKDTAATTYTKPSYRSSLSPHHDTLGTSSMTAVDPGGVRYYRESDDGSSKISLTASLTSQLGINVNDLKSADGTIALTGRYDFSDAKEGASKLDNATNVTYELSLERRRDDGSYKAVNENISNYVTVIGNDQGLNPVPNGSSIVFTDNKTGSKFATRDGDSLALVLGFRVKINTDVEKAGQYYSNYRLVLTAHLSGEGVDDRPVNAQGLYGYDNSDYVTYTLTRVKTSGVDHSK